MDFTKGVLNSRVWPPGLRFDTYDLEDIRVLNVHFQRQEVQSGSESAASPSISTTLPNICPQISYHAASIFSGAAAGQ